MTQFYVTLPSNSSSSYYPANSIAEFKTHLHTPLELSGEWEVGLSSILYPRRWLTVAKDAKVFLEERLHSHTSKPTRRVRRDAVVTVPRLAVITSVDAGVAAATADATATSDTSAADVVTKPPEARALLTNDIRGDLGIIDEFLEIIDQPEPKVKTVVRRIDIPRGFYTVRSLADLLNKRINVTKRFKGAIRLRYLSDGEMGRVSLVVKPNFTITFDDTVGRVLGFEKIVKGHTPPGGILSTRDNSNVLKLTTAYVYCDVVAHNVVGDTSAPLLRVVPLSSNHGGADVCQWTFPDVQYRAVSKTYIDTIGVVISDRAGMSIPFEDGASPSVLCLHFRQVR